MPVYLLIGLVTYLYIGYRCVRHKMDVYYSNEPPGSYNFWLYWLGIDLYVVMTVTLYVVFCPIFELFAPLRMLFLRHSDEHQIRRFLNRS